ncbi:MAG: sulfatase-like hydrolase/transferase [Planctomycetaceae bacterium]|nr:sulfatase-like hydrolase/transferase [Planctomycetaceae bacterium]
MISSIFNRQTLNDFVKAGILIMDSRTPLAKCPDHNVIHWLAIVLATLSVLLIPSLSIWAGQTNSLVIGVDGLGYGQRGLANVSTPNIDSLIDGSWHSGYSGSYSSQAFAGGEQRGRTEQPTVSGPGWSTILTGVWADKHRIRNNDFLNPNYEDYPTYLETLEESVPEIVTASFVNWNPIDSRIIASADDNNSQIDVRADLPSDFSAASDAVRHLRSADPKLPHAVFVALDDVDIAGHVCGSSGACYESAIRLADALVGRLVKTVSSRESSASEEWQIVLTSDHGHRPSGGHGGQSDLERRIPFIVSSKRVSPGKMTADDGHPISHADVAPTVLDHFRLPISDYYWGTSRAGEPPTIAGDFNSDDVVDQIDIDLFADNQGEREFDVNQDGFVNGDDRVYLVEQILQTWFGDSNLDGRFDSTDLIRVFLMNGYEDNVVANSGWATGDWNGDKDFDSSDLVLSFVAGGYDQGPRSNVRVVPEPKTMTQILPCVLLFGGWRFQRSSPQSRS